MVSEGVEKMLSEQEYERDKEKRRMGLLGGGHILVLYPAYLGY